MTLAAEQRAAAERGRDHWFALLSPGPDERRLATLVLLGVCVLIVVVHGVVIGFDRPINWDEAIHFTQVNPWRPAVFMEPHRTRGVSLLVAPIALFDPPMVVMRAYVAVLGAAGTFLAFRTWIPTIGMGAPLAAALFSSHWVTVFYAVEVLPNLPTALSTVAAAGLVARSVARVEPPPAPWTLAVVFLVFGLVRPPDAVLVGGSLALILVLVRRRAAWRLVIPAAAGGGAALLAWFVEGAVRFGFMPLETVRSASEYSIDGPGVNLLPLYVRNLEHRMRCAEGCIQDFVESGVGWDLPPPRTTLFLLAATVLAVVAIVSSQGRRRAVLLPFVTAAPLIAFYGLAGGAMNQRYLMPAFALLLIPVAVGFRAAWIVVGRWAFFGSGLRLVALLVLVATCWWQIGLTDDRYSGPSARERAEALGLRIAAAAGDEPCVVVSNVNYPEIQYWSGCPATIAGGDAEDLQPPLGELGSYVDVAARAADGAQVFAVAREEPAAASPLREWEIVAPEDGPVDGYVVYRHRPGDPLPPPPCPPVDEGPERRLGRILGDDC